MTSGNLHHLVPVLELNNSNEYQEVHEFYRSQFLSEPQFFVRVPGRVNIIGEHVDYCGYPVLPMAIKQSITLAVGFSENNTLLQLRNFDSKNYENYKCDLNALRIQLPTNCAPKWYSYFLCGIKGICDTLESTVPMIGMTVALSGNIPPASGLSSSSALVSAATLATAYAYHIPLECKRLATISAQSECYIGTQGGGMDQAIAYMAEKGNAQFIEFHPKLLATPIRLPDNVCFVVSNSLVAKNKAASSDFNERVVECRLACRLLAKKMNIHKWRETVLFVQLQELLNCSLSELEELTERNLVQGEYTRSEICAQLCIGDAEFIADFLTENTKQMNTFKLRQRTLHVLQESIRVNKFRAVCEEVAHNNAKHKIINKLTNATMEASCENAPSHIVLLSQLMQQSHESLKCNYECSHPDLDRLVAISNNFGVAARLTGAGWGGCIVALCDSIKTSEKYIKMLKENYFSKLPLPLVETHKHNNFNDVVFATFPCNGAEIFINNLKV